MGTTAALFLLVVLAAGGTGGAVSSNAEAKTARPRACTRTISGGLEAALKAATGGQVICLKSGDYGDIAISSKRFRSDVIVRPSSGAAVVLGKVKLDAVSHLVVTGAGGGGATLRVDGTDIDVSRGCSASDKFKYVTYTSGVIVEPRYACSRHLALLWDHDRFDNLAPATWEGRFNVQAYNTGPRGQPDGITISHSHFGGSGNGTDCSDGIDILGNATGTTIGPGNEFTGLAQSGCGAHVDPIQFYGEYTGATITGNWFHDNGNGSGGLMSPDNDGGYKVTNNVFDETGVYPWAVVMGGCWDPKPCIVTHNVFINADLEIGTSNSSEGSVPTKGAVVRDNVFLNARIVTVGSGNTYTATYNLNAGVSGTGNKNGRPVFRSRPATGYRHYRLASSSPGYRAASDRKSMGIRPRRRG